MDILNMGAELLGEKLGIQGNASTLKSALSELLGGAGNEFDLSGLISKLMGNSNLQGMVSSWLGDGNNMGISPDNVTQFFGSEKVTAFASKVGVQSQDAAQGLASVLPQMIDKASSGGSLLESAGGLGGLLNMGKGLFK